MSDLSERTCRPCRKGGNPLSRQQVEELLQQVEAWRSNADRSGIVRDFTFSNYDETVDFVSQVALLAKEQDHHPEISFGYKTCRIEFTTHSVGGVSENDFICAARINQRYRA